MTRGVALVTGAARGIGRACAEILSENGFTIAIHYRSGEQEAKQLAESLPGSKIFQADLAIADQCKDLITAVKKEFGRIDVLVNNAGMSSDQIITFAKPTDLENILDINFKSVFHLSKNVSKVMIKQKAGRIINITSVIGHTGNGGQSMYAASKGAVTAFTKSIAHDLAKFGINANCVAPGFIDTDMTDKLPEETKQYILAKVPLGRLGSAKEVANAVEFLASPGASYITGSTIHVNGGLLMD
jgi:3-oxoacyl-[acyl-carrier protein] reductase